MYTFLSNTAIYIRDLFVLKKLTLLREVIIDWWLPFVWSMYLAHIEDKIILGRIYTCHKYSNQY
jgi:hypothetical protein